MTPTRGSLRDRNRAAIAADPAPQYVEEPATPSSTAPTAPTAEEPPKAAGERGGPQPTPLRRPPTASLSETARIGMYLTPEEFEAAKGAYLADWTHGGAADTFARWIGAAIDTHSRRTPQQRAERGRPRGRAEERTGSTRSFSIAVDTVV